MKSVLFLNQINMKKVILLILIFLTTNGTLFAQTTTCYDGQGNPIGPCSNPDTTAPDIAAAERIGHRQAGCELDNQNYNPKTDKCEDKPPVTSTTQHDAQNTVQKNNGVTGCASDACRQGKTGDGVIRYKMTSIDSGQGVQSTPFIDLGIFSGGVFEINPADDSKLTNLIQAIFDLLIGVTIALSVIMFMFGAFEGIISGGTNTAEKLKGKKRMRNSIYSLVFVLSAWLIINTINPDLLRLPAFSLFNDAVVSSKQTPNTNTQASGDKDK